MARPNLILAALVAVLLLAACDRDAGDAATQETAATDVVDDQPDHDVPPASAPPEALASLRVQSPAEGSIGFEGFGPARFGATAEQVQQAWGGDLGDAQPAEAGGCYYLIPQPLTQEGYRVAFMIEGDRFVRMDVRTVDATAPGGGKVGMSIDEIQRLYEGRVDVLPHKYDPQGKVLRVTGSGDGEGVLVFETGASGHVDAWRVGVPPQVDYVEGCS